MNSITICGTIEQTPKLYFTVTGQSTCFFSISEQIPIDKDGNKGTQRYECRARGIVAAQINEHFSKGQQINIRGLLKVHRYHKTAEITVIGFDYVPS